MRKIINFIFIISFSTQVNAQVLSVPEVIQEQSNWCWSGVSKCVLDYYNVPQSQCDIADYARQVITWYNFGSANCCLNPNAGCNYWNYNWGYPGSIQDILVHFANIQNYGIGSTLTTTKISTEIAAGRPFIVRWGWVSGGGHFVVGHGINGNDVYYMNPWYNEGLHISTYNWLVNDGNHNWTHTNVLTTSVGIDDLNTNNQDFNIYPNPANQQLTINSKFKLNDFEIYSLDGKLVKNNINLVNNKIDISDLVNGVYLLNFKNDNEVKISTEFIKE